MKTYELELRINTTKLVRLKAESLEEAKRQACDEEGITTNCVMTWRVIPTAKQIAKTKSLMRGL